mmetsp:Transcript_148800/g.370764  ORF Transcript_148800/g.370764 Transcript_148800/m.370764 type:complete len:171 (+) Transcript_148800:104-616(+)
MAATSGRRAARSSSGALGRTVLLGLSCTALLAAMRSATEAWMAPLSPGRGGASVALRAAEGEAPPAAAAEEVPMEKAPEPPQRSPDGLTGNMRARLRAEAQSLGDENVAQTAGFGNPYLFVGLIVVVLGVASYYQLGLDKVPALNGGGPGSDQEVMQAYLKTQKSMYGGM